jgi:hypothetical protein
MTISTSGGQPQGIFGGLSYYQLVILFFNIVPLIMEFTTPLDSGHPNLYVSVGQDLQTQTKRGYDPSSDL